MINGLVSSFFADEFCITPVGALLLHDSRRAEKQKSRRAEEQKSRKAEKQKSRKAEKQILFI